MNTPGTEPITPDMLSKVGYPTVKLSLTCLGLIACMTICALAADPTPYTHVVFADDFSAAELRKDWEIGYAESVVKDGVLIAATADGANHHSTYRIPIKPTADLDLAVSFRFEGSNLLLVPIMDRAYKGAHAGHIARVVVTPSKLEIIDDKTGMMKNEVFAQQKKGAGGYDAATVALLKTKTKTFPLSLTEKTWYKLLVQVRGDELIVSIDGKEAGRFSSEGFSHPTKSLPGLAVPGKYVHFDDFSIRTP